MNAPTSAPRARSVNPITQEVVTHSLIAYAEEMALALCKSAYNMMIYEVRDFCCGLIDVQGRMICQNEGGLPIFYRVAALAFSCVAFALIASTGSEECVPIIADAHRVPKADAPPRFWRAPAASRWAA